MDPKNIDTDHLQVQGEQADGASVTVKDDVIIIVTQAFGPHGDSLVGISDVEFDGYPAVTVKVRHEDKEGLVHLSPFHGDRRKEGFLDFPDGARCELLCPVCDEPLDIVGKNEKTGATYYALYLTEKLDKGDIVSISNVWNDYNSRIIDNYELVSAWERPVGDAG